MACLNECPILAECCISVKNGEKLCKRYPLFEVCRNKPPLEVVQELILAFPKALRCKDDSTGFLPLHIACRCGASKEVISHLLESYPDAICTKDVYGRTPIDIARLTCHKEKDLILNILDEKKLKALPRLSLMRQIHSFKRGLLMISTKTFI